MSSRALVGCQSAGELKRWSNQQVRTDQTVEFNGTTTDDTGAAIQVTWNFGDNNTLVNGSSPTLLNTTHVYTAIGVNNSTLTVKFGRICQKRFDY